MPYADIDHLITEWTKKNGITLSTEDTEDGDRRGYFHISSARAETFQVIIEPERKGVVRIDAHLIETWNFEEVHYKWEVPFTRLRHTLDLSLNSIKTWFNRR